MTIFRWIIGVVAALFASGALLAFAIFIITGIDLWGKRARQWRRLASATLMFWFNVEIWRRVALIIIHW
jgi:hypothetical protein